MEALFIAADTYQVMLAVEWNCRTGQHVHLFCTNPDLKLCQIDGISLYNILAGDILRSIDNVLNTQLGQDQYAYFKLLYDPNVEMHVFGDLDIFFMLGMSNIHLHETGEQSYRINSMSNCYGDDDPFVVNQFHVTQEIRDKDELKTLRMKYFPVFDKMTAECKSKIAGVLCCDIPEVPENTILYVHNEPDTINYTADEITDIHNKVNKLLLDIKEAGYKLWVKDHHKRPGGIDLGVADYVVTCPVELIDTENFDRVISVRSKCLEHINGRCYNALTQLAVTKPKGGFYDIYCRGIEKIYKNVL